MLKFKHIAKVGVELEGAFAPNQVDPDAATGLANGGIKCEGMSVNDAERAIINRDLLIIGERNSIPCDNLGRLRKWVKDFYPKLWNGANGFHVHVSFKDDTLRHKIIASKEFHDAFLQASKSFVSKGKYKFGREMLDRVVRGLNGYASHHHCPANRNAVHALSHWSTCEFRLFSGAMNPLQARKVLTFIVTFVEEYLEEHFQREACKNVGVAYKEYTGGRI